MFWGAAQEDVARDAPAMYADGIALPAGACTPEQRKSGNCRYVDAIYGLGSNRPSPRKISNELFQQVGYSRKGLVNALSLKISSNILLANYRAFLSSPSVEYNCTTVLIPLDATSYIYAVVKRSISILEDFKEKLSLTHF